MPVRPKTEETVIGEGVVLENVGGVPGLPAVSGAQLTNIPTALPAQTQVLYVGKHGNDSYDGQTLERAKLTFGAAITAAGSPGSPLTIACMDAGVYTEDIAPGTNIHIYAPNATLVGTSAASSVALTCVDGGVYVFNSITLSPSTGTAWAIAKTAGSGVAQVTTTDLLLSGAGTPSGIVNTSTGALVVSVRRAQISANIGAVIGDLFAPLQGHVHLFAQDVYLNGTTSVGIYALNGSTVLAQIDHILEYAPSNTYGLYVDGSGSVVDAFVGHISTDTAVSASNNGIINLHVDRLSGTVLEATGGLANITYAGPVEYQKTRGTDGFVPQAQSGDLIMAPRVTRKPGDWVAHNTDISIFGYRAFPTEDVINYYRVWLPTGITLQALAVYLAGAGAAPGMTAWLGLYDQTNPDQEDWTVAAGQPNTLVASTAGAGTNIQAPTGEKAVALASSYAVPTTGFYWLAVKVNWTGIGGNSPWWLSNLLFYGGDNYPAYQETYATAGLPVTATPVAVASSNPLIYILGRE